MRLQSLIRPIISHLSMAMGLLLMVRRVKCSRACIALLYVHKQKLNQKLQVELWELHRCILLRFSDYLFDDAAGPPSYHLTIRAELVDMSIVYEPNLYAAAISNCAIISHLSMAMG